MGKGAVERPMVVALAPAGEAPRPQPAAGARRGGTAGDEQVRRRGAVGVAVARRAGAPRVPTVRPAGDRQTPRAEADGGGAGAATDDAAWLKLAALHADDAKLDDGSRALMAAKNPDAAWPRAAAPRPWWRARWSRLVRNFERSIAEDTVRNEYTFHRQIHQWLADGKTADGNRWAAWTGSTSRSTRNCSSPPTPTRGSGCPGGHFSALPDRGGL